MHNSIIDVSTILNEYSQDIQEAITEEAQKVAKRGVAELKNTSPKRTGAYRKGWGVTTTKGKGFVKCEIHNKTHWQLTHLLEEPHVGRNQYGVWSTRVYPKKKHIKPVEDECIREYTQGVENIIKNGG